MKTFFKRFFKGISWVQILSGGLAAGTVFLLSSRLGVAGTVIGAIVASAASTFASQLYQNILNESQKTIKHVAKEARENASPDESSTHVSPPSRTAHPQAGISSSQSEQTASTRASSSPTHEPRLAGMTRELNDELDNTVMTPPAPVHAQNSQAQPARISQVEAGRIDHTSVMPPIGGGKGSTTRLPAFKPGTGTPATPSGKAGTAQSGRKKRIAIIVSIILSLLIVAITAGAILLATNGKGTGTTIVPKTSQTTPEKKRETQKVPSKRPAAPSPSNKGTGSRQNVNPNSSTQGTQKGSSSSNQGSSSSSTTTGKKGTSSSSTGSQGSGANSDSTGQNGSSSSNQGAGGSTSGSTGTTGSGSGSTDSTRKNSSGQSESNDSKDSGSAGSTGSDNGPSTGK